MMMLISPRFSHVSLNKPMPSKPRFGVQEVKLGEPFQLEDSFGINPESPQGPPHGVLTELHPKGTTVTIISSDGTAKGTLTLTGDGKETRLYLQEIKRNNITIVE